MWEWLNKFHDLTWRVWFPKQRALGANVSYDSEDRITVAPPGGGSGPAIYTGTVTVDFGGPAESWIVTVTASESWVTAASVIMCSVLATTTASHDPEDSLVEELHVSAGNLVAGVGFDVSVFAPNGTTGEYDVAFVGFVP
jgi:hypothetical protein